jgi:hypothetical protein
MNCRYVGFFKSLVIWIIRYLELFDLSYFTILGADYADDTENLGPGEDYQ